MTDDLPKTLIDAVTYYRDPKTCFETMLAVKWPDGKITCPKCGGDKIGVIATRDIYSCHSCGRQFSLRVDTIFGDSKLPLGHWLVAVWCVATGDEISSPVLARALAVTQKTAWFLLNRIRLARQLTHKRVK